MRSIMNILGMNEQFNGGFQVLKYDIYVYTHMEVVDA